MNLKEMAISFLNMASSGQVEKAFNELVSPKFIHHNSYFKGDRESLKSAMQNASVSSPNKSIEIKHCYQDNLTVITHSLVRRATPQNADVVVIHILKFENNKIIELWDLGQLVDENSPNENGLF